MHLARLGLVGGPNRCGAARPARGAWPRAAVTDRVRGKGDVQRAPGAGSLSPVGSSTCASACWGRSAPLAARLRKDCGHRLWPEGWGGPGLEAPGLPAPSMLPGHRARRRLAGRKWRFVGAQQSHWRVPSGRGWRVPSRPPLAFPASAHFRAAWRREGPWGRGGGAVPGQHPALHPGQEAGWDRWPGGTVQVWLCGGGSLRPAAQRSLLGHRALPAAPTARCFPRGPPHPDPPSEPSRLPPLLPLPASPRGTPQGPGRSRRPIAGAPDALLPGSLSPEPRCPRCCLGAGPQAQAGSGRLSSPRHPPFLGPLCSLGLTATPRLGPGLSSPRGRPTGTDAC